MAAILRMLANGLALIGGAALLLIVLMTVASVVGRALIPFGLSPVAGDYEIAEALTGVAIFCFLPLCQLNRGHVIVDILTKTMGPTLSRIIDAVSEVLMAIVLIVIAWRLTLGFEDKFSNGEVSFIRQFPNWWAYLACLPPAYVSAVTGVYTAWRGVKAAATGRDLLPEHFEVE